MQIIQQQRAHQEHSRGQQDYRQVVPRKPPNLRIGSWEQSSRASRRVGSTRQLHDDNSNSR